jgi:hypothetical protein
VYRKVELAPSPPSEFELPFGEKLSLLQLLGKNGRNIPVVIVLSRRRKLYLSKVLLEAQARDRNK